LFLSGGSDCGIANVKHRSDQAEIGAFEEKKIQVVDVSLVLMLGKYT
jgi:hypothetical protein